MRTLLLASALALAGCGERQASNLENAVVDHVPGSVLAVGRGYDTLAGETRGFCVVPRPAGGGGARVTWYELETFEGRAGFREGLALPAAAPFRLGLYAEHPAAAHYRRPDLAPFNGHLLVSVGASETSAPFDRYELTAEAAARLAESREAFTTYCGDTFVEAVTTGGHFRALLSFKTRSAHELGDLRRLLGAAAGRFSEFGTFGPRLEPLGLFRELSLSIVSGGGPVPLPSLDGGAREAVAELLEFARDFPEQVRANSTSVPLHFTLVGYDAVLGAQPVDAERQRRLTALERLAAKADFVYDGLKGVAYVLDAGDEFPGADGAALSAVKSRLNAERTRIEAAARRCAGRGECQDEPAGIGDLAFEWPARRPGWTITEVCRRELDYLLAIGRLDEATHAELVAEGIVPQYRDPADRSAGTIGFGACADVGPYLREYFWR